MILQKVLATGRAAYVRKVLSPTTDVMAVSRRNKVVATPAVNKMSTGEKIFFNIFLMVSIFGVPTWITFHIREYGGAT